jgi:hypothetical protein
MAPPRSSTTLSTSLPGIGALDGDAPGPASAVVSAPAQLAPDLDQVIGDTGLLQQLGDPVNAVSLGDRGQVQVEVGIGFAQRRRLLSDR